MMTMPAWREADEYELRMAFNCLDLDGNGYISREELQEAVERIMSFDDESSTGERNGSKDSSSSSHTNKSHKDRNGSLFSSHSTAKNQVNTPATTTTANAVTSATTDKPNVCATANSNSTGSCRGKEDVEQLLNEADEDGNGLIDFEEFVRVLVERRT
jgi:Ca2+-binding EF-hand superfamily protein